jgi:hypothetical protein
MNHDHLQHNFIIGSNFFPDALFQLLKCAKFVLLSLVFKCPRRKQSDVERSGDLAGQMMAPKHDTTRPEKMVPTQSNDPRELFNIVLMLG